MSKSLLACAPCQSKRTRLVRLFVQMALALTIEYGRTDLRSIRFVGSSVMYSCRHLNMPALCESCKFTWEGCTSTSLSSTTLPLTRLLCLRSLKLAFLLLSVSCDCSARLEIFELPQTAESPDLTPRLASPALLPLRPFHPPRCLLERKSDCKSEMRSNASKLHGVSFVNGRP